MTITDRVVVIGKKNKNGLYPMVYQGIGTTDLWEYLVPENEKGGEEYLITEFYFNRCPNMLLSISQVKLVRSGEGSYFPQKNIVNLFNAEIGPLEQLLKSSKGA